MKTVLANSARGREAITKRFNELYHLNNEPLRFIINSKEGENIESLESISVYESDICYHFVTYGLSELYEKKSRDLEYSGFGFELTLKLKKSPHISEAEIKRMCAVLNSLARHVRRTDTIFGLFEHIAIGQKSGIDTKGASKITGFVTILDEAGEINTPNGKVEFVQLVGVTDKELRAIINKQFSVQQLLSFLPSPLTDYERDDAF